MVKEESEEEKEEPAAKEESEEDSDDAELERLYGMGRKGNVARGVEKDKKNKAVNDKVFDDSDNSDDESDGGDDDIF